MTKRILLLLTDLELGGAPLIARDLACGLAARGHDIAVASLSPAGPITTDLQENGILTYALGARNPWDLRIIPRLTKLLAQYQPDILHCFLVHANTVGRLTGAALGVPTIIASLHTCQPGRWWHRRAENATCRLSHTTVCVSNSVADYVRTSSHVPAQRLRIIPNGVDYERFATAQPLDPTTLGLDPNKRTILFVGRLDPVKCVRDLLIAAVEINRTQNVQLLIVGDGPQRQPLEQLAQHLGISADTHFLGPRRDVERILKTADLFILPSRHEGLPGALLEAMAAGLPVAASRTSGIVDVITPNQSGLLFTPQAPTSLAAAALQLLIDPTRAQDLAAAAQAHVRQSFTQAAMLDAYTDLYSQS